MNLPIALTLFVATGALFGLLTHSHRHLFSEGHTERSAGDETDPMQGRFAWTLLCTALWPLMAMTGVFSWWAKRGR